MSESDKQTYDIVKQVLDKCRSDVNLASDACREDIARMIANDVDEYINRLIELIVSPCGIPNKS